MWPEQVSNPGPLAHASDALPTALRDPAQLPQSEQILIQMGQCHLCQQWCFVF